MKKLNLQSEDSLIALQEICKIILQDFHEEPEKLGINPVINLANYDCKVYDEIQTFSENFKLFIIMNEYFKDCVDCYTIIRRQMGKENILKDPVLTYLIKLVTKCRFNLGELIENYLFFEKIFYAKKKKNISLPKLLVDQPKSIIQTRRNSFMQQDKNKGGFASLVSSNSAKLDYKLQQKCIFIQKYLIKMLFV